MHPIPVSDRLTILYLDQAVIGADGHSVVIAAEGGIIPLPYSPAVGFVHSGDKRSFVFDLADTVKFRTVVPLAFSVVAESPSDIESRTRRACRDLFLEKKLADELILILERIFGGTDCD